MGGFFSHECPSEVPAIVGTPFFDVESLADMPSAAIAGGDVGGDVGEDGDDRKRSWLESESLSSSIAPAFHFELKADPILVSMRAGGVPGDGQTDDSVQNGSIEMRCYDEWHRHLCNPSGTACAPAHHPTGR